MTTGGEDIVALNSPGAFNHVAAHPKNTAQVQLESVLVTAADAVISIDPSQRIALLSPAAEVLLGCPAADAVGSPLERFIPFRYRKEYAGRIRGFAEADAASRSAAAWKFAVVLRADGEEIPVKASIGQFELEGETHCALTLRAAAGAGFDRSSSPLDVARHSTLIEQAQFCIYELDLEGCFLSMNPFGLHTFGVTHFAEMAGRPYLECVDPTDRERVGDFLDQAVRGESVSFEFEGKRRVLACSLSPLREPDGKIALILGTGSDVTERNRAERWLRASEQRLRAMANLRVELIGFVTLDGILIDANERSLTMVGVTRAEVLGLPFWDTPWFAHDRDLQDRLRDGISRAAAGEFVRFDAEHPRADGVMAIVDFSLTPLRANDGSVELLFAEGVEVTEQRSAEHELRDALARTQAILDNTVEAIFTMDECGIIRSVNRATPHTFGYCIDELIGASVSMLMPSPDCEEHDAYLDRYRRTGDMGIIGDTRELLGRRRDGTIFPMSLAVGELQLDDERLFVCTCRDLTRRRKAEERARRAAELAEIGTLTAGIAHDVGTPMNIILGYAGMLEQKASNDQDRERLQIIQEQVRRVSYLVQSLLGFARPRETARMPVDVAETIEAALDFIREKLRRHNITVERKFETVPPIRGDREKLQQLFLNLFFNAADAMPQGGQLCVTLRPHGAAELEVGVADTGTGIEAEALDRIFEPFYTTKDRGRGTGLGLLVSRSIVDDHDGDLQVSSEVGKGTEFRITLPILEGTAEL